MSSDEGRGATQGREPEQGYGYPYPAAGRDFIAVRRRQNYGVPTIVGGAAEYDARDYLHDPPAAPWREGWSGLLFSGCGLILEASASREFPRACDGLRQQLRRAEGGGAK